MSEKKKFVIKIRKHALSDENIDSLTSENKTPDDLQIENKETARLQNKNKKTDKLKNQSRETVVSHEKDKKEKKVKNAQNNEIKTKSRKKSDTDKDEEVSDLQYDLLEPDYATVIAERLNIRREQVSNTVKLLDDENTVPFIARYRKEMTGSLDEVQIRQIEKMITYDRNLYERKKEVLSSILSQGKLTKELEIKILESNKISEVEELYLPYKPKKKTRAAKAIEKGLAPLADILKKSKNPELQAINFVNPEKGVNNEQEALSGAMDIIAEEFAEFFEVRNLLRSMIMETGIFEVKKKDPEEVDEFDMYKSYSEPVKTIKNHRILAINRGESKDKLIVKITVDEELSFNACYKLFVEKNECIENDFLKDACLDGYKRLLFNSIVNDIRQQLTSQAEKEAIEIFAKNLYNLLLTPPLKNRRVLAIDPGIRTGSKIAVLDEFGNFLDETKIYQEDEENAIETLAKLVNKYRVELIAIGNGTASRDVEKLVAKAISEKELKCKFLLVPETGASVYSASDVAREEFPDLDVTVRGAISIGRRVLDPLTEYVKIDPKSLGVGQYQHDVNQKELVKTLDEVVEDAVNKVGVFLNTASIQLLSHVSGISSRVAKSIVEYRKEHGPFKNRFDLLKVPGVGEKVFTQAAGFLRIPESSNKLDNSWIHPESYPIAEELLKIIESGQQLTSDLAIKIAEKYGKSKETVDDILEDFKKPGRDPRENIDESFLKDDILSIEDLQVGMILKGTVRNVTDFGAFVDIGIKNDGLVHISELSDKFISDPHSVVHVGQIVEVKVIEIDKIRGRVSLSMKKQSDQKNSAKEKQTSTDTHNKTLGNNQYQNYGNNNKNKPSNAPKTFGDLMRSK
ncbi:MAG TPA: Tex family protein [Exilispira sp.]|nr:Tex family protein [Exilispira sp.]